MPATIENAREEGLALYLVARTRRDSMLDEPEVDVRRVMARCASDALRKVEAATLDGRGCWSVERAA